MFKEGDKVRITYTERKKEIEKSGVVVAWTAYQLQNTPNFCQTFIPVKIRKPTYAGKGSEVVYRKPEQIEKR